MADMVPLYEHALPAHSDRMFVFFQLLDSITHCEKLGSSAWSVTQLEDGFRLNVGQVEALTCSFSFFRDGESGLDREVTVVSLRCLLAGADCLSKIALPHAGAKITELSYRSVGEQHWCYEGRFLAGVNTEPEPSRAPVEEHMVALRAHHHAFLALVCQTSTGRLRQKSNFARSHCEALYEYALGVVKGEGGQVSSAGAAPAGMEEGVNSLVCIRIEKAAADSGYELSVTWTGNIATLRSVQFPETVSVQYLGGDDFSVSASSLAVLTQGASLMVSGWSALYEVLGKVSATARTLPDRVVQRFIKKTATLPQSTEAERWVVQRVGQDLFKAALLDYWQGRCCVTGLAVPGLLRASHIKPWAKCASDDERLDVFNGLLLAPHIDALFDGGWISFSDHGRVLVSKELGSAARVQLGVSSEWSIQGLTPAHAEFLVHHREVEFLNG